MTETHTIGLTGAAGYIGSRVMPELRDAGHDVVPVDDFSFGDVEAVDGVEVEEGDVRDEDVVREAFADVDALFHLAAVSGVPDCEDDPDRAFDVNVGATGTVAWFCRREGIPLVFPASMAIVGDPQETPIGPDHPRDPLNLYGLTKKMGEDDIHTLAEGSFPAQVFMKSNLYGHHRIGDRRIGKRTVINIFAEAALDGETLTVHEPGTQARDFVHVEDVARAYVRALPVLLDAAADEEYGARTLPIASGEQHSILELAELVQRVTEEAQGRTVDVELVENPRGAETVSDDFTVETKPARDTIGFSAERTVEGFLREILGEP
jgi:UDP-glucose 4-epimerase